MPQRDCDPSLGSWPCNLTDIYPAVLFSVSRAGAMGVPALQRALTRPPGTSGLRKFRGILLGKGPPCANKQAKGFL